MLAGLPYVVWPIGSIFILASRKKEDPFLHYHAVQALMAGGVLGAVLCILILGLFLTFRVMPGSGNYASAMLGMTVILGGGALLMGVLLSAIFLGWRATEGEMLRLPIIGDYAEEKMLDQTGMTRREFETMLETSMHPIVDEEIPFPETGPPAQDTDDARATNRLEAMRQARVAAEPTNPQQQSSAAQGYRPPAGQQQQSSAAQGYRPPAAQQQQSSAAQGYRPPAAQPHQPSAAQGYRPPAQQTSASSRQTQRFGETSQSKVREVDLIGHYKEKKVDTSTQNTKADVLRQWLSSVDE